MRKIVLRFGPAKPDVETPGFLTFGPDPAGVLRFFANVARSDDTEREFAVAAVTNTFAIAPDIVRDVLDALNKRKRPRDAGQRVEVEDRGTEIVARLEIPDDSNVRIRDEIAHAYFLTVMSAVEVARQQRGQVDDALLRAAEAEVRAARLDRALDELAANALRGTGLGGE